MRSSPAWSTRQVLGQQVLHSETLSQNKQMNKEKKVLVLCGNGNAYL